MRRRLIADSRVDKIVGCRGSRMYQQELLGSRLIYPHGRRLIYPHGGGQDHES